jgi:hypothetical protein
VQYGVGGLAHFKPLQQRLRLGVKGEHFLTLPDD